MTPNPADRPLAVYSLQPGVVDFGVERMALATLQGLQGDYRTVLIAPAASTHDRAAALGIECRQASGLAEFARTLFAILRREERPVLMTASVEHSLVAWVLSSALRRRVVHVHVAHGGPEPFGYRRKPLLNRVPCEMVAVSNFVQRRLVHYGVDPQKITVIDNFLARERASALSAIEWPNRSRVHRILTVIKLEAWKRPHLIFDAIDVEPELRKLQFRIVGDGILLEELRARAQAYPNVTLPGFQEHIERELAQADLLLQPTPAEGCPLIVLEAMHAGVPLLVSDSGGAGDLVHDGINGFHFDADDAAALARRLLAVVATPPEHLASIAAKARRDVNELYNLERRVAQYRAVIEKASTAGRDGKPRKLTPQ